MERVVGYSQGVLRVGVTAPLLYDRANLALVDFLARLFKMGSSKVSILRGFRSRDKVLRISGLSQDNAEQILSRLRDGI